MNIPSNFNHVIGCNRENYFKYRESFIYILEQILKKHAKDENLDKRFIFCLQCAVYPEIYLKGESHRCFTISDVGVEPPFKILVPGYMNDWESLYHLIYLGYNAMRVTKSYEFNYCAKIDEDLKIILNGFNKNKIMGLAARIRDKLPNEKYRRCLNDIVHCEGTLEQKYNLDKFKGEWTNDKLVNARETILDILNRHIELRPLLEEKEDIQQRNEIDSLYEMNKALEIMLAMSEKKVNKIEYDIHKAGGTAQYIRINEIEYSLECLRNKIKAGLYDELTDHNIDNHWNITWNNRRNMGVEKVKKRYETIFLEGIRDMIDKEKKGTGMELIKQKV